MNQCGLRSNNNEEVISSPPPNRQLHHQMHFSVKDRTLPFGEKEVNIIL